LTGTCAVPEISDRIRDAGCCALATALSVETEAARLPSHRNLKHAFAILFFIANP
jgi:hypothetical protein